MQQVRTATMADREAIRALWAVCFHDSEPFTDWFFAQRFRPGLTTCLTLDGAPVSALQSWPLHIRMRDRILAASMVAGVSTHPDFRGRGFMSQVFTHYMQRVYAQGFPVSINTPVTLSTYSRFGHYPATDTLHLQIEHARFAAMPDGVIPLALNGDLTPLHACYQSALAPYSGAVSRSFADFSFKFSDYASDGAQCLVLQEGDTARGYCVYQTAPDALSTDEFVARDADACRVLLDALRFVAQGRSLHAKLPPDSVDAYPGAQLTTAPQGVLGVANVSALLQGVLGDADFRFAVTDATVPQNEGVWNGAGQRENRAPHIALEAGRLGQLLCGYASLSQLEAENRLTVHDAGAARALDKRLPKLPCYIVDEY